MKKCIKTFTYFNDGDLSLTKASNRTKAIETLMPYWQSILSLAPQGPTVPPGETLPIVTIIRTPSDKNETLGLLSVQVFGATFTCHTLELPDFNNLTNISCIPTGIYNCVYSFSPRFLKYTYEIQGVPKRSGIRIHSASFYSDLKGCIALGSNLVDINGDGELDTINSRITITAFEAIMGKKPFTLVIK